MTWVRLDDGFAEHPKVAAMSDSALALWVTGLAYCNRNLTDGFIPSAVGFGQLRYCEGNAVPAIHELESADLWESVPGGWMVHDFADYQPSREAVLAERDAARARMASVRAKKAGSSAPVRANTPRTSDSPVPVPVPKRLEEPERGKPRKRNILVDTLAEIEGSNPHELTRPQARALGVAVAQIREVTPAVSPDDIQRRAAVYRAKHPEWELTGPALAKHWAQCSPNGRGKTTAEREL